MRIRVPAPAAGKPLRGPRAYTRACRGEWLPSAHLSIAQGKQAGQRENADGGRSVARGAVCTATQRQPGEMVWPLRPARPDLPGPARSVGGESDGAPGRWRRGDGGGLNRVQLPDTQDGLLTHPPVERVSNPSGVLQAVA